MNLAARVVSKRLFIVLLAICCVGLGGMARAAQESGSVGLEGTVPGKAPTQAATITVPTNGQSFTALPITVTGICPKDTLVKLFKNEAFGGSAQCTNGSYSIVADLFVGRNDLIARVFDDLDQQGPDSNIVTVTYSEKAAVPGNRIQITSNYAKRGAEPKSALTWPLTISNGVGPYAVSIDWGDKTSPDVISRPFPGDFTAQHTYQESGIYNVIIKATDKNGVISFLQVVAVANGPVKQDNQTAAAAANSTGTPTKEVVWWPAALLIPAAITTFWLGRRHQLHVIRKKLTSGDRPF